MAFIGNIDTDFGKPASYHIISFYTWDKFSNLIRISVAHYADHQCRLELAAPYETRVYNVSTEENSNLFTETGTLCLAAIYDALGTMEPFIHMTNDEVDQ